MFDGTKIIEYADGPRREALPTVDNLLDEVSRLKKELEEANRENDILRDVGIQRDNYGEQQYLRAECLERQLSEAQLANEGIREKYRTVCDKLSEARAEIEKLREKTEANGAKIDDEDVVIAWDDYLKLKVETRQETARECLEIFELHSWDMDLVRVIVQEEFGLER